MSNDRTDAALDALSKIVMDADVIPLHQPEMASPASGHDSERPAARVDEAAGRDGEELEDPGDGEPDGPNGFQPANRYGLPDGCPIVPLGKLGKTYFYLDALNQLIALSARDHGRNHLVALLSPHSEVGERLWPRKKKVITKDKDGAEREEWIVTGFRAEKCADDLMDACATQGVWDPESRVRGTGAWSDGDGGLVWHCGDTVVTGDGEHHPGSFDGFVYPAYPPLPRPSEDPAAAASQGGPAQELYDLLATWPWRRADVDPMLLLGWIGAAFIGGALDWRPMVFITGDKASGKSTIHKLVEFIFDGAIVQTADTTAAGLYQHVGLSSLPIAVDELEAQADNRRAAQVLKLARLASSGAFMLRGGAEHKGTEFQARSCFLFSAILMPPLEPQDLSRMAVLRLERLPKGRKAPVIEPRYWRDLGRRLRRRLADQWPRWADTLEAYVSALASAGHDARGCDQFGTLLAAADLLMHDHEPDSDTLEQWATRLAASCLRETAEARSNAQRCLDYLCEAQPDVYRGGTRQTVAELVQAVIANAATDPEYGKQTLAAGGLAVIAKRGEGRYLAVPDTHRLVGQLFAGSVWAGEPGVAGAWAEALGRLEGARPGEVAKVAGRTTRCTLIPIALVTDPEQDQSASADAASCPQGTAWSPT